MERKPDIISESDIQTLALAKSKLENIGLIKQDINVIGNGIEKTTNLLPASNYISTKTTSPRNLGKK